MPLPQLICHKFFELIIINHVWFIVKILWTWQLFFYLFTDFIIFFSIFGNGIATIVKINFFFFLNYRQWHCHNCQNNFFFFFLFRQWHYRNCFFFNWPDSILGRGISVTVLPKFLCFLSPPFSFSLSSILLNFGNTVAEILSLSSICQLSWNSTYKAN